MNIKYKILIGIAVLSLLSLYFFFEPVQGSLFPECPFYAYTGLYCPGCGSQRATHDLLHLNILEAIDHNPLMMGVLFFAGTSFLISRSFYYKILYSPKTPWVLLIIVVVFWILRNLPLYPFTLLAP